MNGEPLALPSITYSNFSLLFVYNDIAIPWRPSPVEFICPQVYSETCYKSRRNDIRITYRMGTFNSYYYFIILRHTAEYGEHFAFAEPNTTSRKKNMFE